MSEQKQKNQPSSAEPPVHRVRLPGWIVEREVGLGDLVKRASYQTGIKPCTACEKRAAALNHWMKFTPR